MPLKILINGVTLDDANTTPLLINIKYWQKHNCDVTLVGNKHFKKNLIDKNIINSFKYLYLNENSRINSKFKLILIGLKRNFLIIKNIKKYTNKYDIIHCRSSVLDLLIFPYFLKKIDKKIKWTAVFDNIVPFNDPGNKITHTIAWLMFKISILLLKKADSIFVISPELKDFFIKHKFNPENIIITGNAIETEFLKKSRPQKIKYDGIFIGRINEAKGIFDMLKVVDNIKKEIPNFKLAVMGDGDIATKTKFTNKINKLKLSKNIILLGTKNGVEKFSIIKSSKVFIFLSKTESFGIALLEAVSCGLPSFVYDLPAYRKIYKNNEIKTFKKGDINSISKSIINTFKKREFENISGKKLLGKYSWEQIAKTELNRFKKITS
mgnify:CR=1 FL=1